MQEPKAELTKAILIYTPPQHDVQYRPYEGNLSSDDLSRVMYDTNDGTVINASSLSKSASSIIFPSYTPQGKVYIPHGMNTGRLAFLLELTATSIYGTEREIIRGFTDYNGVSPQGNIDPNMKFHINSHINLRESPSIGAIGTTSSRRVHHSSNVLAAVPNNPNAVSLRPDDAVCYNQTVGVRHEGNLTDTRTTLNGVAKFSMQRHTIPSNYLADICNGYIRGVNTANYEDEYELVTTDPYDKIRALVRPSSIQHTLFYNSLKSGQIWDGHTFSFGDISYKWPRQQGFWQTILPRPGSAVRSPLEYTEHWNGATIETSLAFSLTHTLPALMTKLMLVSLDIALTNMGPMGAIMIQPLTYTEMFPGTVNQHNFQYLLGEIELDIVHGLILPRVSTFDILLRIDLLSNSSFEISINGGPKVPYVAPMFCDSYYSPMIGLSHKYLEGIADSVEVLAGNLAQRVMPNPFVTNTNTDSPGSMEHITKHPLHFGNDFTPPPSQFSI